MSGEPLRLLYIEDSEDDALLVIREISAHGFEPAVRRVETPEALREALEAGPWDLVLSDYNLPGFSGAEALAIVRSHDPDLPFIIISGAIGEETAVRALKAGAHDFVIKGNLARLVPAIERELRDAAARRHAGETRRALGARDDLLRALVDASPAGILVVGSDGEVRVRNDAAGTMFGHGREDPLRDGAPAPAALRDVLARVLGGESVQQEHLTWSGADGQRVELEVSAGPIRDPVDGVTGAVLVAIDVTQRMDLEAQLRQAQKLEAVGRLAGGVAHDFNNILTAIGGYADFLMQDLPAEGTLRSDAAEIRAAADRGSSLTRQLLALSRKQVVEPGCLDLGDVVRGIEKMLRRLIGEDVDLAVEVEPDLTVFADRSQLEQVLMNLVVNARDAIGPGGRIGVRTRPGVPIESGDGDRVVLEVTDNGTGMTPATLRRIFEPFFTTKDAQRGTGLGLSTVQGIVVRYGGVITVDSETGRGTRFRVSFPRADAPPGPPVERARAQARRERSGTILVVEDDHAIRAFAARTLRDAGFTVLEADSGEAALAAAGTVNGAIDLLLTDVILPRGNGPATARRLQERYGVRRVLFISGYTGDVLAEHPEMDVAGRLLSKPFGRDELIARIDGILDGPREP